MIKFIQFIILSLIISHLTGCSYFNIKNPTTTNPNIEYVNWKKYQTDCSASAITNKTCPSVTFKGLMFKHNHQLNTIIEKNLLTLVKDPNSKSIRDYQQNYLAKANQDDHIYLNVKLLEENDIITVLELKVQETHSTDIYSPQRTIFINYDETKKNNLTLKDIIYPDKIQSFWTTAQIAYNNWLEVNQLLNNTDYQQDWPFTQTPHMALAAKNLLLKYEPNTLAPYAMGEPVLLIPYNKLQGILKPVYMPN